MLERIALHQTRLRTPGLGLEGKGVALGAKGLVLLPSLDRLVALALASTRASTRSKTSWRASSIQIVQEQARDARDHALLRRRVERIAWIASSETARLVGGFAFTGTSRHFVQYRDAAAPFGYDATQLISTDAALVLYHDRFTQVYELDKEVGLKSLLLRLMPHVDPSTIDERRSADHRRRAGARSCAHPLLRALARRGRGRRRRMAAQRARSTKGPVRRYVMRIPELPKRMRPLMAKTPGLTTFLPAGPGVAVEMGYRHPVALRACPVFDPGGLVLLRGRGDEPWTLEKTPQMGDIRAFARVELRGGERRSIRRSRTSSHLPDPVRVPLRVVPSPSPWRNVTATWIAPAQIPLLRRIAYALPHQTITRTQIAITPRGAFLRSQRGHRGDPARHVLRRDPSCALHPRRLRRDAGGRARGALSRARRVVVAGALHRHRRQADGGGGERVLAARDRAARGAGRGSRSSPTRSTRALEEEPVDLKLEPLGVFALSQVNPPPPTAQRAAARPGRRSASRASSCRLRWAPGKVA